MDIHAPCRQKIVSLEWDLDKEKKKNIELTARVQALEGELMKKNIEADYPVDV